MRLARSYRPSLLFAAVLLAVYGLLLAIGAHFDHSVFVHGFAAVGTGAIYVKNLPAPDTYVIDPVTFARETSRNRKTYPGLSVSGYGGSVSQKIDATGIVGKIKLIVKVTLTGDGTSPTQTTQWPWNLLKQITVSANGINNLFSCDGLDLRALQRVRNGYMVFDRESSFVLPVTSGTSNVILIYEIPLAFDDESLMGAVFAQTQDTSLSFQVTAGAATDLFSAHAPTLSAFTVQPVIEFYSIPYIDTQNQRMAVIPDLRRMHGFYAQTDALASTSYSKLMRINGVLCRVFQRGDNAANAAGDVDWASLCLNHQFNYGSNVVPSDVPGLHQRMENEQDYGDQLLPSADFVSGSVKYLCDDLVHDNALRDVIHLLGVSQPQFINVFSGLTVSNGNNSVVRTVQEHMTASA